MKAIVANTDTNAASQSSPATDLRAGLLHLVGAGERTRSPALNEMQLAVLQGLARDVPVAELAVQLGLSPARIEEERRALFTHLGVTGIGGLLRHAVRTGVCKPCA